MVHLIVLFPDNAKPLLVTAMPLELAVYILTSLIILLPPAMTVIFVPQMIVVLAVNVWVCLLCATMFVWLMEYAMKQMGNVCIAVLFSVVL
jgi:hypothetical protein